MNQEKKEENWQTEIWLYVGNSESSDKKIGVKFYPLDIAKNLVGDEMFFTPKKRMSLGVGGMYQIETLRDGAEVTARISGAKFIGMHSDLELRNELQIKQRIFTEDLRNRQLEAKHKNGFELPDDWTDIVRLYRKCNGTQKQTFQSLLIAKLQADAWKK